MANKSFLGNALTFAFSLVAYIVYIFSITKNDEKWMLVLALIYFLPLFVDFAEEIQSIKFKSRGFFTFLITAFVLNLVYFVFLFSYMSLVEEMQDGVFLSIIKFLLILFPAICLPIKAYPFCANIMQLKNRVFPGIKTKKKRNN